MKKVPWGLALLLVGVVVAGFVELTVVIGMWSFSRTPEGKAAF